MEKRVKLDIETKIENGKEYQRIRSKIATTDQYGHTTITYTQWSEWYLA